MTGKLTAKTISVRYYLGTINSKAYSSVASLISPFKDTSAPVYPAGDYSYQIRILNIIQGAVHIIEGYIVKFREETPVCGSPSHREEIEVALPDGNNLMESSHFILSREPSGSEVLVYQPSLEGTHIATFARYITSLTGNSDTIAFEELLTGNAYEKLEQGIVKNVEFRVARPRSKKYTPDPDDTWTQQAMDFMNESGASTYTAKIATRVQSGGLSNVKGCIHRLAKSFTTKKLVVKLADIEQPIDLIADQIRDRTTFHYNGNTPEHKDFISALKMSKMKNQTSIDAVIGP